MHNRTTSGRRKAICKRRTALRTGFFQSMALCALFSACSSAWSFPLLSAGHTPASATLPNAPDTMLQQANTTPVQPAPAPAKPSPGDDGYTVQGAEHQRILGIMPEFQAVNRVGKYRPLTVGQKFDLFWKGSTDPFIFGLDAIVAGIGQAKDSNPDFHQGAEGYFKRFGASYADTLDGNFWGNAVLPSAFKEDPRYFRKGEQFGFAHRATYSALTAVWCRRDSGNWGPNYANVLGNLISGAISNAYYPAADRGVEKTFSGAVTVTAEGTIGSELEEFWPDIEGHFLKKHREKQLRQAQAAMQSQQTP